MGDPAGIGPEICAKALEPGVIPEHISVILVGDGSSIDRYPFSSNVLRSDVSKSLQTSALQPGYHYFIDLCKEENSLPPGVPSMESGERSVRFLQRGIMLIQSGIAQALVTAPISKEAWKLAGIQFPGHTEFLCSATQSKRSAMAFVADDLHVALFTTHCSMMESVRAVKKASLVSFITFVVEQYEQMGISNPHVCVAGLNPHAGEAGMFGREDENEVEPAVRECKELGLNVSGPFPADTLFHDKARKDYDLAIALYHDQGLIPIKTLAFWSAVNMTLGLPFVRTSPAHGTAYDIAGKGVARPDSLISAIKVAADFVLRN